MAQNPPAIASSPSVATFGCTLEQAKRMLAKNAEGFLWMADRAAKTGKRYNGFSEAELRQSAADYLAASL